jgi:hypothetical protein
MIDCSIVMNCVMIDHYDIYSLAKRLSLIIVIAISFTLNGCMEYVEGFLPPAPDTFEWRSGFFVKCSGKILSPLETVNVNYENGYVMGEKGKVAISVPRITDYRLLMNATVQQGDGVRIILRKTIHEEQNQAGITLDYSTKGIIIKDGERLVMQTDTIKANPGSEELIKIDSEGKTIRIEIGCSKPCIFTTEKLGTEYVLTSTLPGSRVALNGLEFIPLRLTRPSIR